MIKKIGIMGHGEIGKAIEKFYNKDFKVSIADKDFNNLEKDLYILHICIPYSDDFKNLVLEAAEKYNPQHIVIHSTVKVGTTKWLNERFFNRVVHSPCMGVHPNLYEGIRTFTKFIGYEDIDVAILVSQHLEELGIPVSIIKDSMNTELGKLLDTTYYGLCISYHGYINDLCERLNLDYDIVATAFNKNYNCGYSRLGKPEVIRPILKSPGKKIGGHCVIPNAELLEEQFGSNDILKSILNYK